jgi:tetratricopeptide (TPR) repeat protein
LRRKTCIGADASTLELLQLLVEQGATARLLLLYTARPEFRAQWSPRAHYTQITLSRLSARNVRTMVEEVAARKPISDETIATVIVRTAGVPLFVEELTRAVLESGNAELTGRAIPVTLHDSLMARLDQLGPAKEIIQIGAVIGGEFTYGLLHAVHPITEENLQRALRNLADAELLYVRGIAPDATYQFKHALIRDAAYEALLKSRRKDLHRLVAHTINEKFAALRETQPEVLARHWTEAGETEQAMAQWSKAGKAAESRNAFLEAQESYQQALALLNLLPESPERDVSELQLRQSAAWMLQVARGFAATETIEATERAAALADKSGTLRQLVTLTIAKGSSALVSGHLPAASAYLDQALNLALREGSRESIRRVHALHIVTCYWRGDLGGAEKHFIAGLALDDPELRQLAGRGAIAAFGAASYSAWTLGRINIALEREALMMAAVSENNPYDVATSALFGALLRAYMRDYERAEALAARALELSEKHRFPWVMADSRTILGHARAQQDRTTEGIALIREGIAGLYEIGSPLGVANYTGYLAAAQGREGTIAEALETVEQAL